MTNGSSQQWLVVVARLPTQPSRHRVAVWRELRRSGALALGGGTWLIPAGRGAEEVVEQIRELVARTEDGELFVLDARPYDDPTGVQLQAAYNATVEAEWLEFLSECDKYDAELDKEVAMVKFTLAELEEEEQSLDRLRRWHRALSLRDRFGTPSGSRTKQRLAECTAHLERYAEMVYEVLGQ